MIDKVRRMLASIPADVKTAFSRFPASCLIACSMSFFAFFMFAHDVSFLVLMYLSSMCVCLSTEVRAECAGFRRPIAFTAAFGAAICTFFALFAFRRWIPASDFFDSVVCFSATFLPLGTTFAPILFAASMKQRSKILFRYLFIYLAAGVIIFALWFLLTLLMYAVGLRKLIYSVVLSVVMSFFLTSLPLLLIFSRLPKLPE